jgi:hypothetical protein
MPARVHRRSPEEGNALMRSLLLLDSARRAAARSVDGTGIAASAAAARRRDLGVDRRVLSIVAALALAGVLTLSILLPSGALAAGDANTATCPNEALTGFRPYLADCRAYEMVSPPYKAGQSVGELAQYSAAATGTAVAFSSVGVFGETPASVAGYNGYLATRGNGEWSTVSIDPNTAISPGFSTLEQPSDVSETLSRSVVLYVFTANTGQEGAASSGAFYLREGDGTQVKASPTFKTDNGGPLFGNGGMKYVGGSANLSTLVFSTYTPLLPEPPDFEEGEPRLYEVTGAGGPSPTLSLLGGCPWLGSGVFGSAYHAISRDGTRIFSSCGELIVHVDGSGNYTVPGGSAEFVGANDEGSKVFFLRSGGLYMAEVGSAGVSPPVLVPSTGVQGVTRISSDGSHVYFVATGKLTTETNTTTGQSAMAGADNLYGYDTVTEKLRFVAVLCSGHEESGSVSPLTQCPGTGSDGSLWQTEDNRPAQATPDGRFLVFDSFGQLTAGPEADTDTASDVYEYDFETGALRRISLGVAGHDANGNNNSFGAEITSLFVSYQRAHYQYGMGVRAVTDNGSTVVFTTAEPLSPVAVNGLANVYEWHEGAVSLVSDGHSPTSDRFPVITPSGGDIFFETSDGLLPQDGDGVLDIYDARENGGFAFAPIPPGPCGGEACRGPLSASPGMSLPGSATTASGENVSPSLARAVVKKAKAKTKGKGRKKKKGRKMRRSRGHAFAGSAHTTLRGNAR